VRARVRPRPPAARAGIRALDRLDPALGNRNPALAFLGVNKQELTAFFANTAAATQGTTPAADGKPLHYLRTTNPVSTESLAAYPNRQGSNRPNAYALPGAFRRLGSHLQVFENRQCRAGAPLPAPPSGPNPLDAEIASLFFTGTRNIPAPPCDLQAPVGKSTGFGAKDYPQVAEQPRG
jgi:phospholipid/cholesterol/gamma-HCH transport system substrate-binding protein